MRKNLSQIEHQEHKASPHHGKRLSVALLDLKDPLNVGQAFRLGSAMGIETLWLLGSTPCPPSAKITRTARGAEQQVRWQSATWIDFLETQRAAGWQVIALEYAHGARRLEEIRLVLGDKPCVLLVGNEQSGINSNTLEQCDAVATIPMFGSLSSLNVAAALGIGLWEWVRASQ